MSEGIPYGYRSTEIIAMHYATGVVHSYTVDEVSMRGCLKAERDKDVITSFVFSSVIDSRLPTKDYPSQYGEQKPECRQDGEERRVLHSDERC